MGHRVVKKEIRPEVDDEAEPERRDQVLNRYVAKIDRWQQQRRRVQPEAKQEHRHQAGKKANL